MNQELKSALIVCVFDKSGSMRHIKDDAIGGFNSFIEKHKRMNGKTWLTLVLFDTDYEKVFDYMDVEDIKPIDTDTYVPGGCTALLNAIGRSINETKRKLALLADHVRSELVIFVILTDGLENASRKFSTSEVSRLIDHQQEIEGWEFAFLAANQDAFQGAGALSMRRCNTRGFEATRQGIRDSIDGYLDMPAFLRKKGD
ncbi:MAG: VWA domain-containing protein [Gammaproteobacteria bacterium]|nr:VWA domain-containing protein [Gammaproteobacteria bacterium]